MSSVWETPLSLAGVKARPVGGAAVVSSVTFSAVDGPDTLPARSVWVAVKLVAPGVRLKL
jgi:hypothetical protein